MNKRGSCMKHEKIAYGGSHYDIHIFVRRVMFMPYLWFKGVWHF